MTNFAIVDQFANTAADLVMRACIDFIIESAPSKAAAMTADDSLVLILRTQVGSELDVALDDAKQAYEAGMHDVALLGFKTAMVLAGIKAAKTWLADQNGS
jgi:hypothetical protein